VGGFGTLVPAPAPSAINRDWVREGAAAVSSGDLVLTTAGAGVVAGSSFYAVPIPTNELIVSFTISASGGAGGAGMCLALADPTQTGPAVVGGTGPALGFTGIPGFGVALNTDNVNQLSIVSSTASQAGAPTVLASTTGIPQLRSGTHTVTVSISGNTLSASIDGGTPISATTSIGPTALVGFTAANGSDDDTHIVRNVTILAAAAVPTPRDRGAVSTAQLGVPGGVATLDANGLPAQKPTTPWRFDITAYGAVGDGQIVTDGAITNGSHNLACTTSRQFKAGDVGKPILVPHAGAGGTTLSTTISGFTDSGHIILTAAAGATVASGIVMWSSDDTMPIQNAINAGAVFATSFTAPQVGVIPGYEVYTPPGLGSYFGVAGPLITGGSTLGNGQLTIPIVPEASQGVTCRIVGVESGAKTRYWNQATPAMTASTWLSYGMFASAGAQTTSAASGRPAIISGPSGANGYGVAHSPLPIFSNVTLHIKNMSLLTAHSNSGLGYDAVNAHGCARMILEDMSWGTTGTVVAGDYNSPAGFANGNSFGITMPANGNNAMNSIQRSICQGGYTYDIIATEHTVFGEDCILLYGWVGLGLSGTFGDGGTGVGALHAVKAPQLAVEGCSYPMSIVGPGSGGLGPMFRGCLDTEGTNQFRELNTGGADGLASASSLGELRLSGANGTISTTYPVGMQIINDLQASGPVATPSYTLGVAQINAYWRWATVTLNGGTVTDVKISTLMGGASAPTLTPVWSGAITSPITIRIPPGGWWQIDGSVKPTVNTWILD
jgi:hypothetical protein